MKFNLFTFRHILLAAGVTGLVFILFFSSSVMPFSTVLAESLNADGSEPFITVLAYHHIIPGQLPKGATSRAVIPLSEFEAQMKYLYDNGYYTASLKDVEDFIYHKKALPEKTVLITFDDGYESNFVYAFPVLKIYNFRATIFLIGNRIVQKEEPFDPDRLSMLSFRQIKEMLGSGLVEFGSHTFNAHEYIGNKPALLSMDKEQIEEDFIRENELFAKNGLPSSIAIAYPYGRFNSVVLEISKKFGLKLGFNLRDGIVRQNSDPYTLNRIVVPPGTDIQAYKTLLKDFTQRPPGFKNTIFLKIGSRTAYIKGRPSLLDYYPFIQNGSTMVPLRFIAQSLGARVDWIPAENKITVSTPEKDIELWVRPLTIHYDNGVPSGNAGNSSWQEAVVNGKRVFLEAPPIVRFDRVMVPLRFLSEALGFEVKWYQDQRMVEIMHEES
ncbi:MAG TPA: polysaccharide deacetylase family protein [Thermoanaerobacterales bacterium]|nr:polysaccharide deacetylase family protein [Thermoanaerobacterales bacterium]